MPLPRKDRWERKLKKRGPKVKRSGRYTKRGDRPRSATKKERLEAADAALKLKIEVDPLLPPDTWYLKTAPGSQNYRPGIGQGYESTGGFSIMHGDQTIAAGTNLTVKQEIYDTPIYQMGYDYAPRIQPITLTSNDMTGGSITWTTSSYTTIDSNTIQISEPWEVTRQMGIAGQQMGGALITSAAADTLTGHWLWEDGVKQDGFARYKLDPMEAKKEEIKRNLEAQAIANTLNHHGRAVRAVHSPADFTKVSQSEIIALQLMKSMIPDREWKRYLRYGFVVAQGKSGMVYQILRGQDHVRVFRKGNKVAELCIKVPGVPPTDEVIARKIMVECDEMRIWHDANIHQNSGFQYGVKPTEEDLVRLAA